MRLINLVGLQFGRLIVLQRGPNIGDHPAWECLCACRKHTLVAGAHLRSGRVRSCGCLLAEVTAEKRIHGHSHGSPTYKSWDGMIQRCTNPNNPNWPDYGGRGIAVCDRWRQSFGAFLADMGERPEDRSIDRIDVDGDYEPNNCRWATATEQANNTRRAKARAGVT